MGNSDVKPLTVVDLFCGAGGLSLGFRAANCRILAAVDYNEIAARTFESNFRVLQPETATRVLGGTEGDLSNPDFNRITAKTNVDILIGGPPCQGFSRVGRGKLNSLNPGGFENDPRNRLYRSFLAALTHWKPLCVVMENVPGMLNVRGMNLADTVAVEISERGYDVGYAVLNACWYGVPQFRERIFFVGFRKDVGLQPRLPHPSHTVVVPHGYEHSRPLPDDVPELPLGFRYHYQIPLTWTEECRPAFTVQNALADLPALIDDAEKGVLRSGDPFSALHRYRSGPGNEFAKLMRNWPGFPKKSVVDNQVCRSNTRDYETFRRMKPGDRYPQALAIAHQRLREALGIAENQIGRNALEDTEEYAAFEKRIVPPYPVADFTDKWRKLIPDEPSWTVTAHLAKDGYSHIHYDDVQARTITVREAARLQSFPDAFEFHGNLGDRFRQIGNAVPPLLALRIAEELTAALRGR